MKCQGGSTHKEDYEKRLKRACHYLGPIGPFSQAARETRTLGEQNSGEDLLGRTSAVKGRYVRPPPCYNPLP
jgi:hypothetical protein